MSTYEEHFVECLAQSLAKNRLARHSIDQAYRLKAVGFDGPMDPITALLWLAGMEKILDEGM